MIAKPKHPCKGGADAEQWPARPGVQDWNWFRELAVMVDIIVVAVVRKWTSPSGAAEPELVRSSAFLVTTECLLTDWPHLECVPSFLGQFLGDCMDTVSVRRLLLNAFLRVVTDLTVLRSLLGAQRRTIATGDHRPCRRRWCHQTHVHRIVELCLLFLGSSQSVPAAIVSLYYFCI